MAKSTQENKLTCSSTKTRDKIKDFFPASMPKIYVTQITGIQEKLDTTCK
jgi:hypothetical protein